MPTKDALHDPIITAASQADSIFSRLTSKGESAYVKAFSSTNHGSRGRCAANDSGVGIHTFSNDEGPKAGIYYIFSIDSRLDYNELIVSS